MSADLLFAALALAASASGAAEQGPDLDDELRARSRASGTTDGTDGILFASDPPGKFGAAPAWPASPAPPNRAERRAKKKQRGRGVTR